MKTKLLLLLLMANFSIYSQTNLVPNGDFEIWNGSTPQNWTVTNTVTSSNDASEGQFSTKLSYTVSSPKIVAQVPLKAGITYVVKYKYKYLNANYGGDHPISLKISQNGSSSSLSSSAFATNNSWTQKETDFTPDSDMLYDISFSTFSFDSDAFDVLIDDVQVYDPNSPQYTLIPDLNFENKLISLGIDSGTADGKVLTSKISSITTLDLYFSNITDLKGIEDFTALTNLSVMSNKLTTLDISKNVALTNLNVGYNKLTSLNTSKNIALQYLSLSYNEITSLDLSQNSALLLLSCTSNKLANLDLSNNKTLTSLWCSLNQFSSLDLSKNTALSSLLCSENILLKSINLRNGNNKNIQQSLVALNFTKNPALECILVDDALFSNEKWTGFKDIPASFSTIDCSQITAIPDPAFENKLIALNIDKDGKNGTVLNSSIENITTLDVSSSSIKNLTGISGFKNLTSLDCSENLLTALDLSNNTSLTLVNCSKNQALESLNIKNGNNTNFNLNSKFSENPALSCIQVDDDTYSNTNWTALKENTASYSTDCNKYTIIPDSNFEDKLIALGIDKDGKNGKVKTESIRKITSLDLQSSNISDLSGIEDFTALLYLDCMSNTITNINVKNNKELRVLNLHDNKLSALDLSENAELFNLTFSINKISTIDLSQNKKIHSVAADRNLLTSIDFSNNPELEIIYCGNNQLTSLNVSNLPNLLHLNCIQTEISELDVTSNSKLETLYFNNAKLTTLDLSKNPALKRLNLSNNLLTSLDLSHNPLLELVFIEFNPITTLNVQNGNNKNFVLPSKTGKSTAGSTDYTSFLRNAKLSCIQVDDVDYSNANWSSIKDSNANYSSKCTLLSTEDSVFNKVTMYPNPTKGEININNVSLEKATVYNSLGQLVKSFTLNSSNTDNTINLSGLPKGVYYIYLINGDAASAKKIILE